MKKTFILLLIISCVLTEDNFYDRRYDYYDIDQFVENPRLLKKYLDCFLEKGPCTPVGRVFKGECYIFPFFYKKTILSTME